jgi:hypothetical protein
MRIFFLILAVTTAGCANDEAPAGTDGTATTTSSTGGGTGGGGGGGAGGGGGGGAGAGAGTGGHDVGAGGATGATEECVACFAAVFTPAAECTGAIHACDDDPACNEWKDCGEACFNEADVPSCYEDCNAQYPHEASLSDPLWKCLCDSCASVCVAACSVNG